MRSTRACLAAALAALAVLAGCGDEEGTSPEGSTVTAASGKLTRAEVRTFQEAERTIQQYCVAVAAASAGQGEVPSVDEQEKVFAELEDLIEVVAAKPTGEVRPGLDARLLLDELGENLEGSNCDSRLVERIDAALASLED